MVGDERASALRRRVTNYPETDAKCFLRSIFNALHGATSFLSGFVNKTTWEE